MTEKIVGAPTCKERVHYDSWHPDTRCARAVKDEGLCGIHLAAKRKRAENAEKARQKFEAEQARLTAARTACEKIPGSLPHYGAYSTDGYDGRIVVPAAIAYEYDALKAVEAATRGRRGRRNCTCKPNSGCVAAVTEQAVIDALDAIDAIRKTEAKP